MAHGKSVPVIVPATSSNANDLVVEKFGLSIHYANEAFILAMGYLDDLTDIVRTIENIDTSVELDKVGLDPSAKLDELLRDAPVNPIKNADYNITTPTNLFTYAEDSYLSTLLSALNTKLLDIVNNGGSPLGAVAEQAMFDRETERDELINQDARNAIAADWAESGLSLPGGGLFNMQSQVDVNYQNKMLDKNRAITEETRRIAIETTKHAFEQVNSIEQTLMTYTSGKWERKLQAAGKIMEEGLIVFRAAIEKLKVKADVYGITVQAFAAEAGAITKVADVQVAVIRGKIEYAVAKANLVISQLSADIRQLELKYGFSMDATKAGSQIASQLAASSLAATSASAYISTSESSSTGSSISVSESSSHVQTQKKAFTL